MTAESYTKKHLLEPADILFARTGGTVGKTYYYDGSIGKAVFAGYCIRFRFDKNKVLPKYVYWCTKTDFYNLWVKGTQRPSGQPNINKEEFKSFQIPLLSLEKQKSLVDFMDAALEQQRAKLEQAEKLINSITNKIADIIGIKIPDISIELFNAVKLISIYLTLVKPLLKQPKLIESLIPKGIDEKEKSSVVKLINVLSGNHIIEKIKGLAELSGQDSKKLEKELFDIDVKLKAGLQNIKVGINKTFAICCFSEASDNVLMWSHYGNKHTGFCVEYDFSRCKDLDALIRLFPVQYTNERPSIPTDLFDLSDIKNIKVAIGNKVIPDLMMLLLTKSRIWEYENEWRIIGDQANLKDGHIQDLPIESGIYLGANISSINAERITRIARDKRINLYKYHIDNEKYKLCLEKVKN